MVTLEPKKLTKRTKAPLIAIIPFFFVLVFFATWSFFDKDAAASEVEGRSLAQRPVFDLHQPQQIIGWLEDYVVDQFPMRSKFLKAYSMLELAQDKVFTRDLYREGDWMFGRTYRLADNAAGDLADAARQVADRGIPTYYAMLPVKSYLVAAKPSMHVDDASEFNRQKMLSKFSGTGVTVSDIAGAMASQDENTRMSQWYKTDFHWSADGAYAAAQQLLADMGVEVDLSEVVTREVWETKYIGDLGRRFSGLIEETQPVVAYAPSDLSGLRYFKSAADGEEVERQTIVAAGKGMAQVDYGGVYTQNMAYYRVTNQNAPVNMRVVVLKDSLENAMTDILSAVFSELVVVDGRYGQPLTPDELLEGADAVVFMFHQNNAAPDTAKYIRGN